MEQLTKLKRLRIEKDELLITIREKEEAKTKSAVYLAIFVLLLIWMVALLANPSGAQDPNSMNESGAKFLKFVSGKFLIVSLVLMYRTHKINKEIRELEKEYEEMKKGVGYLSN
ncbi:hypothetical protein MMU07_03135 [Aquiflexum sp. LQ15W]|uniref:hypothetical protein n=1 Tax=Cognataquiflexum nitidum TaxID=2922272 RepID=UPI001F13B26F|nr:hypothetical protein [Cognataquiflexum nitidum]MCH6198559.1 hypothetical protein [Cognataquiflexum nitidum]